MHIEHQYLNLLQQILDHGTWKENRTGIRCKTIANTMIQHDMSSGFPLMTHRKLAIRSTLVELEGFLNGITSKEWYQQRGCKYWDHWANPEATFYEYKKREHDPDLPYQTQKEVAKEVDDLGPIYGFQWRNFGYDFENYRKSICDNRDQLFTICKSLKENPNDRRMICSAWNPTQLHLMALPPCHMTWGVIHINGTLNLWWLQRSCDFILGIPANITSYAALLLILCKFSGFTPGVLTGYLCDTHIYENHLDGVQEILRRKYEIPYYLPKLEITNDYPLALSKDWLNVYWTHKDYKLNDYRHLDPIKFEVAI
jgi:thymidylate synthase